MLLVQNDVIHSNHSVEGGFCGQVNSALCRQIFIQFIEIKIYTGASRLA